MQFKLWVIYGILFVGFATAIIIVSTQHLGKTKSEFARKLGKPIPVKIDEAKEIALEEILGTNGLIQPIKLLRIIPKITTNPVPNVETISVDIGDTVIKGQPLIQLDTSLAKAAVKTAQSAQTSAKRELFFAQKNLTRLKDMYETGLQNAIQNRSRAVLNNAAGELKRAESNLKRIKTIFEQNLLSKTELEKAQAEVSKARVLFFEAEENRLLAIKNLTNEVETAKMALDKAKSRLDETGEKLLLAENRLKNTTLVSPVSGIIMERFINEGELPRSGQELLTIGRIDQVLVEANFSEEKIGDINLHQKANVTFSAFQNDQFQGEVIKIKPVTDPKTRSFLIYVKLSNPGLKLKPGLSSYIRIQKTRQVLAVQSIALINPTGARESAVFKLKNNNKVTLTRVKTGSSANGMTEIIEGLTTGDRVVVVGQYHLKDGDQVRIGKEFDETVQFSINGKIPETQAANNN